SVLLVNVCVVSVPTRVVVASGNVTTLLAVWAQVRVVAVLVVPPALKRMVFVLSLLSAMAVLASSNVLFVRVSVVARPTSVSVDVGKVRVPVLEIVLIIGVVNVLWVS